MSKKLFTSACLLAIVAAGTYYYVSNDHAKKTDTPALPPISQASLPPQPPPPEIKHYTMDEVAAHGFDPEDEDCWMVIHNKVYDLTEFAATKHPGGELIYKGCGQDATMLFETRPTGSQTPHSSEARIILEKYYVGELTQ